MKTILCFGDSNTWGYDPASTTAPFPRRHPLDIRWTGVLARLLGPGYRIIEEGQNGRTTVHDDPLNIARKGKDYLPACLESHKPIDLVIMMLGTNDLKTHFHLPPSDIAAGAGVLARLILSSESGPDNRPPQLLLLCPPLIGDLTHLPETAARIEDGPARSAQLPRYYEALATTLRCPYLNTQPLLTPSPLDGVHFEASQHQILAQAIALKVKELV